MKTANCRFAYVQPSLVRGFEPMAMFNLLEAVPGHAANSTVSAPTLALAGYAVPAEEAARAVEALAREGEP